MEREKEVETGGTSGRGARTAVRSLYPVVTRLLTSTPAANGEETPWIEADPTGWDAPISVWWDSPPCQEPR
jgi:hypothetical protein